uniref:WGS project CBMI000000000 data, contig CS3069_c003271 n=1 Tax=Fusarium clavum TaxID=2594811 RepID=A0A090MDN8_9HYPO|nr:unnamed protein product [Fusarium clavum]
MKTTEVPPGAATATINAQILSLQACIKELSEEIKALEAKYEALEAEIEALEELEAQDAEKYTTKMKDLEDPKNEEDDIDPELTKMQDAIIDALWELDPYDKYGPDGEIAKKLDNMDMDDFLKPPPGRLSLFPEEMLRRG